MGSAAPSVSPCRVGSFGTAARASLYASDACNGTCPLVSPGRYCPPGSASPTGALCVAGYGCPTMGAPLPCTTPGRYCPAGSPSADAAAGAACDAGTYGLAASYPTSSCAGPCAFVTGNYCPSGSTTPIGVACPLGYHCAAMSAPPVACVAGRYGSTTGLWTAECSGECLIGFYCPPASTRADAARCAAGRYADVFGATSSACVGPCAAGYFCPAGSALATAVACPAGTFGNTTGLGNAACSGPCPSGYYCVAATVDPHGTPCRGGKFASSPGSASSACGGDCAPGYYCPPGSVSGAAAPCNSSAYYCPGGSEAPLPVSTGFYAAGGAASGVRAAQQFPCTAGTYCRGGQQYACSAGSYGVSSQEVSPTCSGPCAAGYYCPAGSTSALARPCGNSTVYCPAGSAAPLRVAHGSASVGWQAGGGATAQEQCPPGSFCAPDGVARACPYGTFGNVSGLAAAACSGVCADGYECPAGSPYDAAAPCPGGFYCTRGVLLPCPWGAYYDGTQAASAAECVLCPAGTYSAALNVSSAAGCVPCTPPDDSGPGALACWPGVVAAVASDAPPVVPSLSPGDVLTITFSRPTNAPPADTDALLGALLSFSTYLGEGSRGVWNRAGTVLSVTLGADGAAPVDLSATRVGVLTVAINASGGLRDARGASQAAATAPLDVTGDWGVATVPEFMVPGGPFAPAFARDTGGNAGLGAGDSLVLRFDNPCKQLPLGSTADVDALLAFSAPIGAPRDVLCVANCAV